MALYRKFRQMFKLTQKQKQRSSRGIPQFFAIFQTISKKKKRSSCWSLQFFATCQTISNRKTSSHWNAQVFAQIKLFGTKKPIFQIALWPYAKCSMAHWLRTTGLDPEIWTAV